MDAANSTNNPDNTVKAEMSTNDSNLEERYIKVKPKKFKNIVIFFKKLDNIIYLFLFSLKGLLLN